MKIKRLYIKILLSFVGVMVVTEILILGLFVSTAGHAFKTHFKEKTISKLRVFKSIIQDKMNQEPETPLSQREDIIQFLSTFSSLLDVDIWLIDSEGSVVLKTPGSKDAPIDTDYEKKVILQHNIVVSFKSRHHLDFYAKIPLEKESGGAFVLKVQYTEEENRRPEGLFVLGLLIIGIIIAILVIPLSRLITRRVNQLNESALHLAGGELSFRADIAGKDEIAKLGESFNFMADRIEQMIRREKELTANISHELRSPLARIQVSKEILKERLEKKDDKDLVSYLNFIEDDIRILDKLIGDILKMSKSDLPDTLFIPESVDISGGLSRLLEKFKPAMEHKQVALDISIQDHLVVKADREGLDSVFSNVLDNAVKYTPVKGSIKINASFQPEKGVVISIANSARELSPEEQQNIFHPFFRRKDSIPGGSGLGLHIAQKILKRHHASITVENIDQGIMFQIVFPAGQS